MQALLYVELDIEFCEHVWGVPPCEASGPVKCFNTRKTCGDLPNYSGQPVTLRFALATDYLPKDIEAIPSIIEVDSQPAIISLDGDLGQRATFTIKFKDHPYSDTGQGFDKYVSERAYNPFRQGSFWGKFRARQPYLRGRSLRVIRGLLRQELAEMETRHYIVESFDGPKPDGTYELVAKDVLKLADGDRAQAPVLSNGFLVAGITSGDVSATLSPAGVGAEEYPASGHVAIGGNEICAFTRSGDVLALTRGQLGTAAVSHGAQDRVQLVLRYVGIDPAVIISDLLENYAGVDGDFIPLAAWQYETGATLQRVYSANIAEPTAVKDLISELIEQAGLAVWWDDLQQIIRLQVLRAVQTDVGRFTEDNVLRGSLKSREQPEKRESQCWVYFGMINPLQSIDDPNNYRSVASVVDVLAEVDYGSPAIKKIYSRWIAAFGRAVAEKVGVIRLSRFRDPPRRFNFDLFISGSVGVLLGGGYRLEAWPIQDALGAPADAPLQLTRMTSEADRLSVEAEEILFTQQPGAVEDGVRQIIIDTDTLSFNLAAAHDSLYPAITGLESPAVSVVCLVAAGVIVGSINTTAVALNIGDWPVAVPITLDVRGRIQGAGGQGGDINNLNGNPGGRGLYTRAPINLKVSAGKIFSGGGGGGAVLTFGFDTIGGGGGAGRLPGVGGYSLGPNLQPQSGTLDAGGVGATAVDFPEGQGGLSGTGGYPGTAGGAGQQAAANEGGGTPVGSGGPPGAAIDGVSFVTVVGGPGDIRGPQIN